MTNDVSEEIKEYAETQDRACIECGGYVMIEGSLCKGCKALGTL